MEMSRVGGYAFGVYIILWCLLHFYNRFNADQVAIQNMYSFGKPLSWKKGAEAKDVLENNSFDLDYGYCNHLFRCTNYKSKMFDEARDKKNIEYDISYWAYSARQTHFLGYLEEKPKVVELAIFENSCRFEAQFLIHHE
jgi:hypothetical protein